MQNLYQDYRKFERIMRNHDGSDYIDTSKYNFLAPTTIIPLLCRSKKLGIKRITTHQRTHDYIRRILNRQATDTNTPYRELPHNSDSRIEEEVADKMANNINKEYGGHHMLYYILDEIIDNVYNHTPFEKGYASQGYTYSQEYPRAGYLDICVMDDGLSIPGRFKKGGINFDDECRAIEMAIDKTTTEEDDEHDRGNGLWTTLKLVVEANGGSALIVSGKGCLYIKNKNSYKYILLDNKDIFSGTLVSLRLVKKPVFIYDYIDIFERTPYKYKREENR